MVIKLWGFGRGGGDKSGHCGDWCMGGHVLGSPGLEVSKEGKTRQQTRLKERGRARAQRALGSGNRPQLQIFTQVFIVISPALPSDSTSSPGHQSLKTK